MELITAHPLMTRKEARECIDKINANMNNIRSLVLNLYEGEGWKALGYKSWRECVMVEFKTGQSHIYRMLDAAKTERNISPMGENQEIPERHLRPLSKLPPAQQKEAWDRAVQTAPQGKVTAKHVENVVQLHTNPKHDPSRPEFFDISLPMKYAEMAISQLERITPNDPDWREALEYVAAWITKSLEGDG